MAKRVAKKAAKKAAKKVKKKGGEGEHRSETDATGMAAASVPSRWWEDLHSLGVEGRRFDPCRDVVLADGSRCVFDADRADRVVGFFSDMLRHGDGQFAHQPFELTPWQRGFVGNLFGWVLTDTPGGRRDGLRRFRSFFLFVPRKNGKTELCAGLVIYALIGLGERGAQVYTAASDGDQAALMYDKARDMVQMHPALDAAIAVQKARAARGLYYDTMNARYRPLTSNADTKDGANCYVYFGDEVHAHRDDRLASVIRSSMGARREPIFGELSTAGEEPRGYCADQVEYSKRIIDGRITEPTHLPALWYASAEDVEGLGLGNPELWRRCNPNYGVVLPPEHYAHEWKYAQDRPAYLAEFKRKYLNIFTEADHVWMPLERWDRCAYADEIGCAGAPIGSPEPALRLRSLMERSGRVCDMGADLSRTTDLTALVFVFEGLSGDGLEEHLDGLDATDAPAADRRALRFLADKTVVLPFVFAPHEGARARAREDHAPYLQWARDGLLELTPGDVIDEGVVRARILGWGRRLRCRRYAFDRAHAVLLQQRLQDEDGLEVLTMPGSAYHMSAPTKRLETITLAGTLAHGGHAALRWAMGHCVLLTDQHENVRPHKGRSRERIDPVTATIVGLAVAQRGPAESTAPSVYESRGMIDLSEYAQGPGEAATDTDTDAEAIGGFGDHDAWEGPAW